MYGFTLPEIRERVWRTEWEITRETFEQNTDLIRKCGGDVNEWTGEDRDGNPLTVVWTAQKATGFLLSAFEFTERQKAA